MDVGPTENVTQEKPRDSEYAEFEDYPKEQPNHWRVIIGMLIASAWMALAFVFIATSLINVGIGRTLWPTLGGMMIMTMIMFTRELYRVIEEREAREDRERGWHNG